MVGSIVGNLVGFDDIVGGELGSVLGIDDMVGSIVGNLLGFGDALGNVLSNRLGLRLLITTGFLQNFCPFSFPNTPLRSHLFVGHTPGGL